MFTQIIYIGRDLAKTKQNKIKNVLSRTSHALEANLQAKYPSTLKLRNNVQYSHTVRMNILKPNAMTLDESHG